MEFRALVGKEFRALLVQTVFGALLIVAADIYMYTRIEHWGHQVTTMVLMVFIPASGLWALISGQMSLHSEWNRGTVHWLLAYPLSGWSKVAAKLFAGVANSVVFLALAGAGMILILGTAVGGGLDPELYTLLQAPGFWPLMAQNLMWAIPIGILMLASLYLLGHVSYAAGKIVHKASWLVNGAVLFGLSFAGPYLLDKFGPLINRIPPTPFYIPVRGSGDIVEMVSIPSPAPALLVVSFVSFAWLFLLAGWLLERRAEV